jgi:hypothetical protein
MVRLSRKARFVIGLVIPFLSVIPTVPLLNHLSATPFGLPLGLLWLFCSIPLTALCLAICWLGHDRARNEDAFAPRDGE